jgi:hypothetical protein
VIFPPHLMEMLCTISRSSEVCENGVKTLRWGHIKIQDALEEELPLSFLVSCK